MVPVTRIDYYLAAITNDSDAVTPLPEPVTRIDFYLAYLAGENVSELPEPVTRIESYLAKLCGMDVEIPEAPITRIDFYLAVLNGETVDLPNAVTRIDYYLDAWAQGGGDLPWETFVGNPLQFDAPRAHTLKSVKVEFSPIQDLHGYANPWPAGGGRNIIPPITTQPASGDTVVEYATEKTLNGFYISFKFSGSLTNAGASFLDLQDADGNHGYITPAALGMTAGTTYTNQAVSYSSAATTKIKKIVYYRYPSFTNPVFDNLMLVEGTTAPSAFIPYENICPITGWTGVDIDRTGENLCFNPTGNTSVTENPNILYPSGDGLGIIVNNTLYTAYAKVAKNTDYTFSCTGTPQRHIVYGLDGYPAVGVICHSLAVSGSGSVYTFNSGNYDYVAVYYCNDIANAPTNIQINLGSTASPYAPYTGETTTLSFPSTVYGGTAEAAEDGSGQGSGTYGYVDMGTLNWQYDTSVTYPYFWAYGFGPSVKPVPNNATKAGLVCSQYETITANDGFAGTKARGVCLNTSPRFICYDPTYTDKNTFASAMSGVQLAYELATPVTYHLDPVQAMTALRGINTMWSDTNGDLTVEARAESVQLNALQSLNMLLGGRYVNNHGEDDLTDEEALSILMGGER